MHCENHKKKILLLLLAMLLFYLFFEIKRSVIGTRIAAILSYIALVCTLPFSLLLWLKVFT